jgi:hypothetical protein
VLVGGGDGVVCEVDDELLCLLQECAHCGQMSVPLAELAPDEQMASLLSLAGMCERHWSNAAQGLAKAWGLTSLQADEYGDALARIDDRYGDDSSSD